MICIKMSETSALHEKPQKHPPDIQRTGFRRPALAREHTWS